MKRHEVDLHFPSGAQRSGSAAASPERSEGEDVGWNLWLGDFNESISMRFGEIVCPLFNPVSVAG